MEYRRHSPTPASHIRLQLLASWNLNIQHFHIRQAGSNRESPTHRLTHRHQAHHYHDSPAPASSKFNLSLSPTAPQSRAVTSQSQITGSRQCWNTRAVGNEKKWLREKPASELLEVEASEDVFVNVLVTPKRSGDTFCLSRKVLICYDQTFSNISE
ncbi:hypothetical protein LXL04_020772 [Taraxacum kok-saghyz]